MSKKVNLCQFLEGPISTWKDNNRNIGVQKDYIYPGKKSIEQCTLIQMSIPKGFFFLFLVRMILLIFDSVPGAKTGGDEGAAAPPPTKKRERRERGKRKRERRKKEKRGNKRETKLNQSLQEHIFMGL